MKRHFYALKQTLLFTTAIVLMANRMLGQQHDIYVYDVKTGTTRQVTHIPDAGEFNVSWSNNGKKIAHDVVGGPAAPYGSAIFVTDVATGDSRPLAGAEGGNDAAWSPDGNKIAFDAWGFHEEYYITTNNLYVVAADGGTRELLRYHSNHASWSPNGQRIAFEDNWYGYIGTMGLNGGSETFVTYGSWPSWSPNGRYIAFNGWQGGVWVIAVDIHGNPQGEPYQLTSSGYGPTWSANSKSIVYIDWPNGDPDLYSIPLSGGVPTRLTGRTGGFDQGDYDPAYSNNGQYIAYSGYTEPAFLNAARLNHTGNTQDNSLTGPVKPEGNFPNPFHTQTTIAFEVEKPTPVVVDIYNSSGQKIQNLVNASYEAGSYHIRWNGKDSSGQAVPSGMYFYQLQAGNSVTTRKMHLIR